MAEGSGNIRDSLYTHLSAADRERALFNLDRYFEIVLQIFLRIQSNQQNTHTSAVDVPPQPLTLEAKGRFLNK